MGSRFSALGSKLYKMYLLPNWKGATNNAYSRWRDQQQIKTWLKCLEKNSPDVLLGANFAPTGGVRHHLQSIQKYSNLRVSSAPSDALMERIGERRIRTELAHLFRQFDPAGLKAVHSHVYPWFIQWCSEMQRSGVRWVHTYHLNYYPEHSLGELLPWQREMNEVFTALAPKADVRISVSQWQSRELLDKYGISTNYLPNGVDVIACAKAEARRFTSKWGYSRFVLYVGRDDPVKNPGEFVRLAWLLPEWRFVMVGAGLNRETLAAKWSRSIPDNLHVIGSLSHAEVMDAIAACSALVVTSKREGLPTLVLEAMALCKAIVVPNEAGCMEAIGQGEAGHIYEMGNVEDLAERLIDATSNSDKGLRGRNRVEREYDWRVIAPKLDQIYLGST